jgi:hypothetical protein
MVSETKFEKIDMSNEDNLGQAIIDTCQGQAIGGWELSASFTYDVYLFLIFQK